MDQSLQNNIKLLPPDIKDVWQSQQKFNTLFKLSQKYDLYENDMGPLINEVDLILLNLEDIESLESNLQRELEINPITASRLAEDINEQIFAPIKVSLQKIQQERRVAEMVNPEKITDGEVPTIPTQPTQPAKPPLNRIPEVRKINISAPTAPMGTTAQAPNNLPTMAPEQELVVQKNMVATDKPKFQAIPTPTSLPKTFGETPRAGVQKITPPIAKPTITPPINPPKPQLSPSDQFFVSRPKPTARGIVENRLGGSFNMPQERMNMSETKPAAPADPNKKVDPYREPIE